VNKTLQDAISGAVMGRRKQSPLEDMIDVASLLPWWVSLIVAGVGYFILHSYAGQQIAPSSSFETTADFVSANMWKQFAHFGQYLWPFVFVFGSILSFIKKMERQNLYKKTQERSKQAPLLDMSWQEFEILIGEAFRQKGFQVQETGGAGPDGGIDLVLRKGSETFLVQCKQWRAQQVNVKVVRELYGVMAAKGAAGGFVVSSGKFTVDAMDFATGRNIELINGEQLLTLIRQGKAVAPIPARDINIKQDTVPDCPRCGIDMVRRVARQGANAGKDFWGCGNFPTCRETKHIG
jgi:restriction system protein